MGNGGSMVERLLLLGIAWIAGCSGFAVRPGGMGEPIPGPETNGPVPGTVTERGGYSGTTGSSRQIICRGAPYPRGWVAVDYVDGGSTCGPTANSGTYSGVVIQRLAVYPGGTLLIVCAGQSIPRDWRRVGGDPVSSGQCPRNVGDKNTGPTIMQIEKRP